MFFVLCCLIKSSVLSCFFGEACLCRLVAIPRRNWQPHGVGMKKALPWYLQKSISSHKSLSSLIWIPTDTIMKLASRKLKRRGILFLLILDQIYVCILIPTREIEIQVSIFCLAKTHASESTRDSFLTSLTVLACFNKIDVTFRVNLLPRTSRIFGPKLQCFLSFKYYIDTLSIIYMLRYNPGKANNKFITF